MESLGAIKTGVEVVQGLISARTSVSEAAQLDGDLCRLRDSLPNARLLIDRADRGRFKNKELDVLLSRLKDATYDAEDLLRRFHDQELRHKMEDADRGKAGQLISKTLRVAKHFFHGSKSSIKETQSKIDRVVADTEGTLIFLGLNIQPVQLMPETTSVPGTADVVGRDKERDELIKDLGVPIGRENERGELMRIMGVPLTRSSGTRRGMGAAVGSSAASSSRGRKRLKGQSSMGAPTEANHSAGTGVVPVLTIVGIGGVGKTTLAQFIYNDERVKAYFPERIWVCVSDLFDKTRMTREILDSISGEESSSSTSLNVLQEKLMKKITMQRYLLVLDDVWPKANDDWEAFYKPLRYGLDGSMILVTTRSLHVASCVATIKPLQLEGLPANEFLKFFNKCAFGEEKPESYPQLQGIGQSIADRLCGSPLAAKTLGRLLNMDLTEQHWRTIQNSELWELEHRDNEILPALQLSYLYLPHHLKRCFAFCSTYPKDYSFERDEIVDIWVAQGFVVPTGGVRLEDIGSRYLDDLRSRFLFQSDPKFLGRSKYVMHDLIHDMAVLVSADECILIQDVRGPDQRKIPPTVRHMSIGGNNESLSRTAEVEHFNKLRSVRFGIELEFEIPWFNQLSNILFLSLRGCKLTKLPESVCGLNSLRCLDISRSSVEEVPDKFWGLYSLQFFYAKGSKLQSIHPDIVKLINMRCLSLTATACKDLSRISGLGSLSSLRNLSCFVVGKENGRKIGELRCMNQLSGTLSIKSIKNVKSSEEAAEARLVDKQYLKALHLNWGDSNSISWTLVIQENEVLEAMRPPSIIETLRVQCFGGDNTPSWFNPESLPSLKILELSGCGSLTNVPIHFPSLEQLVLGFVGVRVLTTCTPAGSAYPPLTRLTNLCIRACDKLINVEKFLYPENLPFIKSIELANCTSLLPLPVHKFVDFHHLQDLHMSVLTSQMSGPTELVLPPSLRRLSNLYQQLPWDRSIVSKLPEEPHLPHPSASRFLSQRKVRSFELDGHKHAPMPASHMVR